MRLTGSIIPADHVYKTVDNKWIISGTYNTWMTHEEELFLPSGLCLYIRLITESARQVRGVLELRNSADDPRVPMAPVLRVELQLSITPDMVPIAEARLVLGSFRVPGPPLQGRSPQRVDVAKMTLHFSLFDHNGELYEVSKAPLTIVFKAPPGSVGDHGPRSDDPGHIGPAR